jgi:hypothetical protein
MQTTSTHHLFCYHDNGFYGESPVAVVEEVLQRGTKKINDENVMQSFLPKIVDVWNSSCQKISL